MHVLLMITHAADVPNRRNLISRALWQNKFVAATRADHRKNDIEVRLRPSRKMSGSDLSRSLPLAIYFFASFAQPS
jgi:hypothetical protein